MNQCINIGRPKVYVQDANTVRMAAEVELPTGPKQELYIEVPKEYGDYLTADRSDAFLVGLLHYALYHGFDVKCEAAITGELHYHLSNTLIPALTNHGERKIEIVSDFIDGRYANAGAVGSGISCGVDSMHILQKHLHHPIKSLRLTHLVVNNVGAFRMGSEQFDRSLENAQQVIKDVDISSGVSLIKINSNLAKIIDYPFEWCHTYCNAFPVLALGKLYGTFIYGSSGYDFSKFSCYGAESIVKHCDAYDSISLQCFSACGTKFILDGGALTRFEKTRDIVDFDLAQRYLNVCVEDNGRNCGHCEKCRRTLLCLDALGALDKFRKVFDLDAYRRDRWKYLGWALYRHWIGAGAMTDEALMTIRGDINWRSRVFAIARRAMGFAKGI